MNLLYLDEIEKNIDRIEAEGIFDKCWLVLFGANKPSEKMLLSLKAKGIKVDCVIDNNSEITGKCMCGVRICTPEEGLAGHTKEAVVLIASKYYKEMKKQVVDLGCQENRVYQMAVYQKLSTDVCAFEEAQLKVQAGLQCHEELLKEFGRDVWVIMCPYNGIGDMYFIGAYISKYCEKMQLDNIVVTVVSNTCFRVAKMFGIHNVKKLEQKMSDSLMKYASFIGGEQTGITVFTHTSIHWDVLTNFERAERMDWGTMFRHVLMGIGDAPSNIPENENSRAQAEEFMKENRLTFGKTAIVSPYANTITGLEDDVWNCIVQCLQNKGYDVYTNSTGEKEPALLNTKPLAFPIEIAREVVEYAGVFVGIRSGLCDVIESAKAKIFVLYPNRRLRFFNLAAMGFGEHICELDCEQVDVAAVIGNNV